MDNKTAFMIAGLIIVAVIIAYAFMQMNACLKNPIGYAFTNGDLGTLWCKLAGVGIN